MNFFKSVFSDEPTPPDSPNSSPPPEPESGNETKPEPSLVCTEPGSSSTWSFNAFIKTLATKSESVIENYRKDWEELGSGLKKETAVIRDVASRAVMDLPASLEVGASVAQESLESVGQAIDDIGSTVWKSTARIISRSKRPGDDMGYIYSGDDNKNNKNNNHEDVSARRYSRFELRLREIERNLDTYIVDPGEGDEFEKWKKEWFVSLEDRKEDIERLVGERNGIVREMYNVLIGGDKVDEFGFWSRYFFRVDKLKQAEEASAMLVKRAILREEGEELSWDFDDVDEEDDSEGENKKGSSKDESSGLVELGMKNVENVIEEDKVESVSDEVGDGERKSESVESSRDSDVSVVSRPSLVVPDEEQVEDDVGWDEIEDIGSNDEAKGDGKATTSSTTRDDLRKRLTVTEEDEDLSWDVDEEDDGSGNKQ